MDPQAQLEAIDLKQEKAARELYHRLYKELELVSQVDQAIAVFQSELILDRVGALDKPVENNPIPALIEKKEKLIVAIRWSVYDCTNKMKQWVEQAKELTVKLEESQEE